MIVLDSSAAVDYLLRSRAQGEWVALRLVEDDDLHAPHLLDVEVLGALRRLAAHGEVTAQRAARAVRALPELDLLRYPALALLEEVWSYRHVLSAADATYVALAKALDARLLTTDGRLSRAPNLPVEIIAP